MTIDIIFPVLPPRIDGIGDYTACLSQALAKDHEVRILSGTGFDAIDGVETMSCFNVSSVGGVRGLINPIVDRKADLVLLQYNPFSYGKWGFAPRLGGTLKAAKARLPETTFSVMIHERWVDVTSWKTAIMTTWQRQTLRDVLKTTDLVFVSTESWLDSIKNRCSHGEVFHLPVGSNIPHIPIDREEARRALNLQDGVLALGIFGTAHPSRQLHFIKAALEKLREKAVDFELIYIGTSGEKVVRALHPIPVNNLGTLDAPDVSTSLAAVDIYLAPFAGGVAERRGSFLVGIQHGIPTVSTKGAQTPRLMSRATDAFWLTPDDEKDTFADSVFALANSPELRAQMSAKSQSFFKNHFSWDGIAESMIKYVQSSLA